ncbi:hypothetical protein C0989_004424 [Termitomyces sp. Mn162]|nr:hypothetical protein C0989_004424 [Termitomyces sp. Mn162]
MKSKHNWSQWGELGDEKPGLKLGNSVVMGLVEVVVLKVKLTADEGARGTAVNEGREELGQAVKLDIDDKQMHGPQAELQKSPGGGIAIKEFEGDQGGEASEMVRSKHCQGFINEVIHGAAVD